MGHSSIKVAMDIYGHLMEPANHKAAEGSEAGVFGSGLVASGSKIVAEDKKI